MQNIELVRVVSNIVNDSVSADELCKKIAHDPQLEWDIWGVQLHSITDRGNLKQVSAYGLEFDIKINSLFEDSAISKQIREMQPVFLNENEQVMIPLQRGTVPVGILAFNTSPTEEMQASVFQTNEHISNLGGLFLDTLGIRDLFRDKQAEENPASLTERQLEILEGMGQEKTNLEISRDLMVSESTVKQETVRIYRALAVSTRQHAAAKSKAIGLLSPPPR